MILARRLLLAIAVAAGAAGCAVAYKTDILRKDVLTDAQKAVAIAEFNNGDMTIQGAVDRPDTTYDPGQPITLSVATSKDSFVAILRVLPSGDTAIVFPNRGQRVAWATANRALTIPSAQDAVKIAVDKPGIVLFEFIASTNGKAWPFTRAPDNGADFAELGVTTRDIVKDLESALKTGTTHDVAATYLTVRIAGRGLF
jgi:hypothetical protein